MMKMPQNEQPTLQLDPEVGLNIKGDLAQEVEVDLAQVVEEAVEDVVEEAEEEVQGDPKDLHHQQEVHTHLPVDLKELTMGMVPQEMLDLVETHLQVDLKVLMLGMVHQELVGLAVTLLVATPAEMLGTLALIQITTSLKHLSMTFNTLA